MTNTFRVGNKVLVLLTGLSVLAVMSGCDQTAQEFHQQTVENQLQLIQAHSGDYNGTVSANGSNCGITVHIDPKLTTTTSPDGTTEDSQASASGKVTITCAGWSTTAMVPVMAYAQFNNSDTANFNGDFNVSVTPTSASQATTVQGTVAGTITGSQMTGTIDLDSENSFTADFAATLNGASNTASGSTGGISFQDKDSGTYAGSYPMPCPAGTVDAVTKASTCTMNVLMTTASIRQESADFVNFFAALENLNVTINVSGEIMRTSDGYISTMNTDPLGFSNATLDQKNGRIDATGNTASSLDSLTCEQIQLDIKTKGWNCQLGVMAHGTPISFIAAPSKKGN